MHRLPKIFFLLIFLLLAALPATAADPFYEDLYNQGVQAQDNDAARAAKVFRLACFGLLEEEVQLANCLTRLAVAQGDVDDKEGFRKTVQRLAVVEQRFRAFSDTALGGELKRRLEAHLVRLIPQEELARIVMFRHLAKPSP